MWAYESILYQIYPLGFCGAPFENDCNANGTASSSSCNLEFKDYNALHDCKLDDRGTTCGAWAIINGNMIYLDDKQVFW